MTEPKRLTPEQSAVEKCVWTYFDDDDYWETTCGNAFCIMEGTPGENMMHYCPYCGGKLVEEEYTDAG